MAGLGVSSMVGGLHSASNGDCGDLHSASNGDCGCLIWRGKYRWTSWSAPSSCSIGCQR